MINEIQEIRKSIEETLVDAQANLDERIVETSPCGRYELDLNFYATASFPDRTSYAIATVRRRATGDVIATLRRNDESCFYGWVTRDGRDYFLFAEDLEGQSIVDLVTGQVAGFSSKEETFIWCEFYSSPDGSRLAIFGCYWACPYMVTIYDFREPMTLPLPILAQFTLPTNDSTFVGWTSNDSLTVLDPDKLAHGFSLTPTNPG